jgi:hypothetical protein
MGGYDSDSSDDDARSFTETNVLLGYASKDLSENDDPNSFIGGEPVRSGLSTALVIQLPLHQFRMVKLLEPQANMCF